MAKWTTEWVWTKPEKHYFVKAILTLYFPFYPCPVSLSPGSLFTEHSNIKGIGGTRDKSSISLLLQPEYYLSFMPTKAYFACPLPIPKHLSYMGGGGLPNMQMMPR